MTKAQLIRLLKSGNFTIAYHNQGVCSVYRSKMEYEKLPKTELIEIEDNDGEGYAPGIVELLVEALNGACVSI